VLQVAEEQTEMAAADIAAMFIALIRFAGAVYPDRLEAVDDVLAACQQACAGQFSLLNPPSQPAS
jgi:hypothetical protein